MTMISEPLAPWMRDLSRLFETDSTMAGFMPPADVIADDDGVTVYMDLPGLRSESLDIEIENDTLAIRGERQPPPEVQDGERTVRRIERRFGRFERTLRVPGGLNADGVDATLVDGVLTLRAPKAESAKPHRIEIKAGG
jgi:HSP20 family protein